MALAFCIWVVPVACISVVPVAYISVVPVAYISVVPVAYIWVVLVCCIWVGHKSAFVVVVACKQVLGLHILVVAYTPALVVVFERAFSVHKLVSQPNRSVWVVVYKRVSFLLGKPVFVPVEVYEPHGLGVGYPKCRSIQANHDEVEARI